MYIDKIMNHGKPYLRVMEGYRKEGSKNPGKRVVCNIGPLDRFDDGEPGYLERLRESFRLGDPLIPSLKGLAQGAPPSRVSISFDPARAEDCVSKPKNIGYFALEPLYRSLGVGEVMRQAKSSGKLRIDLDGIAKLLVFGRIMKPASKKATFEGRGSYAYKIADTDRLDDIYEALTELDKCAGKVQQRMRHKMVGAGRAMELCYYDVTNFWFPIDKPDGEGGLRKRGFSKENRKAPIVQMGLLTDSEGIPVAYKVFPGNMQDQSTLQPFLEALPMAKGAERVIVVADAGVNGQENLFALVEAGNGYIVAKSARKLTKECREWMLGGEGWEHSGDGLPKSKSRVVERILKRKVGEYVDKKGKTRGKYEELAVKEKQVAVWTKKYHDREAQSFATTMEGLHEAIKAGGIKTKPKKGAAFLSPVFVDPVSGEEVDAMEVWGTDQKKIDEWTRLMRYRLVLSSETGKADSGILSIYSGLSRIEDSFRVEKSDLEGRPVFVRTPEHINAHFLVCFIALAIIRLMQKRVLAHMGKPMAKEDGWEQGIPPARLQTALREFHVNKLPEGHYVLSEVDGDIATVLGSIGVDVKNTLYKESQLRGLKSEIIELGGIHMA